MRDLENGWLKWLSVSGRGGEIFIGRIGEEVFSSVSKPYQQGMLS